MSKVIKCLVITKDDDGILIAFELREDYTLTTSSKITFHIDGKPKTLLFEDSIIQNKGKSWQESASTAGKIVYAFANFKDGIYYSQATCDAETYNLVCHPYSTFEEKRSAILTFLGLKRGGQNNILIQAGVLRYGCDDIVSEDLTKLAPLELKADICAETMPPDVVRLIRREAEESEIKEFRSASDDLKLLANIYYGKNSPWCYSKELVLNVLRGRTFLSESNILTLATALTQERDREMRILLEGPDDCGQRGLIKILSFLKNYEVYNYDFSGLASSFEIVGASRTFHDAVVGIPLQLYEQSKTNCCTMVYENIGDLGRGDYNGDPSIAVKRILDKEYFDVYHKVNVPIGASLIFATTYRIEDLKPSVLNMFDVKLTLTMSDEDKIAAFKRRKLSSFCHDVKAVFTDRALRRIADFTDDYSLTRFGEYASFLSSKVDEGAVIDEEFVERELSALASTRTPFMTYKLHRSLYSEEIAKAIEDTNRKLLEKGAERRNNYSYLLERIQTLSKLRHIRSPFCFDRERFLNDVNESHYGLEKEKQEIADYLTARAITQPENNLQLYFVGPPGCGKSSLATAAAKAQGVTEICRIDLTAVTVDEILGLPNAYQGGGHCSLITASLARAGSNNIAIILEEFEKARPDVINVLLKVLDDDHCFRDRYLDVNIDLSGITVIATANGTDVQLCSLDRFRVFSFDALSKRVKEGVFDKAIRRIEAESTARMLSITVTPEAKELILDEYAQASSVRELDHKLRRITEHILTASEPTDDGTVELTIDAAAVRDSFPEKPYTRGNFATIPYVPGVVRALAVTGSSSGMTFGLEAAVYYSSRPDIRITGLADDTVSEQVELACSYLDMHYRGLLDGKRICVHFGEGSVHKSGCSAGAATLLAILSAALGVPIDRRIAITGEISLHGGINSVGGIMQKADGAIRDGCHTMIMPKENLDRLPAVDREYLERQIRLIGVSSVDELVKLTIPTQAEAV